MRSHTRSLSLKINGGRSPAREAREERQSRDLIAKVLRTSKSSSLHKPPPPTNVYRSRSTPRRGSRVEGKELAFERDILIGAKFFGDLTHCIAHHTSHIPQPAAKVFPTDVAGTVSGLKYAAFGTTFVFIVSINCQHRCLRLLLGMIWTQGAPLYFPDHCRARVCKKYRARYAMLVAEAHQLAAVLTGFSAWCRLKKRDLMRWRVTCDVHLVMLNL